MRKGNWIMYPALFTKSNDGQYFVEFPDLPGCYTQGETLKEAILNAQEALAIYYQKNDCVLGLSSDVLTLKLDNPNVLVQVIAINTDDYIVKSIKAVKKTLTLPEWLNEIAEKYEVNFSGVLKSALIERLKSMDSISAYDRKMLND